ncbi:hypothetical protein QJS10_CPA07g00095 [Acorus calamus]|uniref:Cucumisin n=1 Tax=Acorus calamus TaxID=4465 RepID=A0AAV9EJN6_ACOCL|nr:hypothetical protein QJS10_CPA07g00095 [Acorus calamus]
MVNVWSLLWAFIVLFVVSTTCVTCTVDGEDDRKVYIVYMGAKSDQDVSVQSLHLNILEQVFDDDSTSAAEFFVQSYGRSFNGFAAKLTQQQKQKLAGMQGIVSVVESKTLKPHTTRSWDFLGFTGKVPRQPTQESDIIVGMIDTGVWPELESFSDKGLGSPPKKWQGACHNMTCNNKIIGARYYNSEGSYAIGEDRSPRDTIGHGTHTASTVAGAAVIGASLYGLARGTARGATPSARIAVYKVCWNFGCADHDVLAAFDDAIADGVDVISISAGGDSAEDYTLDPIAIGSFHAMRAGILTSASAGNGGPGRGTASNVAPWLVSVAASTIDRRFVTRMEIGNHKRIMGQSINTFSTAKNLVPLIYGVGSRSSTNDIGSRSCVFLAPKLVKGKIVLCDEVSDGTVPLFAGAQGVVMADVYKSDVPHLYPLPATTISFDDKEYLLRYLNKTRNPVAKILKSEEVVDETAPNVASFSSRGPNMITHDVLKPDVSAPGLAILAAWSPKGTVSRGDKRSVKYNII